jgi:hypothetical protein
LARQAWVEDAVLKASEFSRWLATLCLFVVSGVVTSLAVHHERAFLREALRADGLVVSHSAGKHHVNVRFMDEQGRIFEHSQNGMISYDIGRRVKVLYRPLPPSEPSTRPTPPSATLVLLPDDPLARLIAPDANVHWVNGTNTVSTDAKFNLWGFTLGSAFVTVLLFGLLWSKQEGRLGQLGRWTYLLALLTPALTMLGSWLGWIGG